MKLNLGAGDFRLEGFVNLDLKDGWRFEDGLPLYADASVDAITISHSLMYVRLEDWPAVFAELARVLKSNGVIRITEDDTANPFSERHNGHHDAVALTSPENVTSHLDHAGFRKIMHLEADISQFDDDSLLQAWHGETPKVFFTEAVKA